MRYTVCITFLDLCGLKLVAELSFRSINFVFNHESSYCFQRVLAIAILSVRPSDGWISQKRCKLELPNFHHRLP